MKILPKFKQKKFDVSIIWWIIIPYAVLFLCFTLFMNYMLQFSNDKLKDEMYTAHNSTFNAITSNIESLKYGLDSLVQQISNNKNLISISQNQTWDDSDVYYSIYNLNTDLNRTLLPYNSVKEICIYYPLSDNMVISGSILNASREYKNYCFSNHISKEESYDSWKSFMLSPHNFELYRSDNGDIFYVHSVKKSDNIVAAIILNVNNEVFKNLIVHDAEDYGIIIYNHLNDIVFFSGKKENEAFFAQHVPNYDKHIETLEIKDTSYIQILDNSTTQLGLSYYIADTEFYKSAKNLTTYFYRLIAIFILLSILLSLYFTKVHYRSVSDIMNTLKKFSSGFTNPENTKNEYTYIKNSVQTLSEQLIENEITINKQNKTAFLSTLKKHLLSYRDSMEPSKLLEIYHISFSHKNYIASLVTINYADENYWLPSRGDDELIFSAVSNLFCDYSGNDYQSFLVQLDEDTALMITGTEEENKRAIVQNIEKIFVEEKNFCSDNLNFDFYVHISDVFSDIDDAKAIYEKLRSAHYINPENAVTFQSDIPNNHSYDYGFLEKAEYAIQKSLEENDFKGTEKLLNTLFEKHTTSIPSTFLTYINIRILNVFSALIKNLETDSVAEYLNLLSHINPKTNSYKAFVSLAEYYCRANSAGHNTSIRLSEAVAEYVNTHFEDCSLNVNTLSYAFDKSPSYISSLFKAETGKMLNQYISETRMQHATLLLLSDKNVDKIAAECGFSDITTFRRTFKRYIGVTPSEYRKNHKGKEM